MHTHARRHARGRQTPAAREYLGSSAPRHLPLPAAAADASAAEGRFAVRRAHHRKPGLAQTPGCRASGCPFTAKAADKRLEWRASGSRTRTPHAGTLATTPGDTRTRMSCTHARPAARMKAAGACGAACTAARRWRTHGMSGAPSRLHHARRAPRRPPLPPAPPSVAACSASPPSLAVLAAPRSS